MTELGDGFWRVVAKFGFMEKADVPQVLARAKEMGVIADRRDTTQIKI
ncbi:MAG: hypothetical protein Q7S20_06605 [Gemmatimonadaceae bacterium]|nr:hypothetical protein [Gemmatimonadaceae bacterium]